LASRKAGWGICGIVNEIAIARDLPPRYAMQGWLVLSPSIECFSNEG
jgi:hypothetical protein